MLLAKSIKVHVPVDDLVGGLDAVVAAHGDSSAGAETFEH